MPTLYVTYVRPKESQRAQTGAHCSRSLTAITMVASPTRSSSECRDPATGDTSPLPSTSVFTMLTISFCLRFSRLRASSTSIAPRLSFARIPLPRRTASRSLAPSLFLRQPSCSQNFFI